MGVCLSIDEATLRIECSPGVRALRLEKKRLLMEFLSAESKALELLRQMPGRKCTNGVTRVSSIFTKQGRKGINQDCMLVWEEFAAVANTVFCGVFDGHGKRGHLVARQVRDSLPLLLALPSSVHVRQVGNGNLIAMKEDEDNKASTDRSIINTDPEIPGNWKEKLVAAYEIMDQNLKTHPKINSFRSGTTAITMVVQDKDLVIGNVGDSRAVLARRAGDGSLVADQLTTEMKPDLPGELERIRTRKGRVFALEDEPTVARIWRPHDDMPGLAMSRALGDFCLKEYGLSAVPEVSHRRLTQEDEFVVLATDGVWDVLSNDDVLGIVSSAWPKETAAKRVVEAAVKKWKRNHGAARTDDCAVVCYFLKETLTPSVQTTGSVNSKRKDRGNERVMMGGEVQATIDYTSLMIPWSLTTTLRHLQVELCPTASGGSSLVTGCENVIELCSERTDTSSGMSCAV